MPSLAPATKSALHFSRKNQGEEKRREVEEGEGGRRRGL
jgi:hypothetical protein